MNKIKFSHEYSKMPFRLGDLDRTILLEVFISNTSELHESFINYDTHIEGKSVVDDDSYYPLPSGKILILLLKSFHKRDNGIQESHGVWTTIRRWTPEKERYYRSIRGQHVEIVVSE